jgi:hypothetical protein
MAPTIEELDATVSAFYDGRGEQVRPLRITISFDLETPLLTRHPLRSKKPPKMR